MMNSRHLPAGQGIPLDTGRRRSYNQNQNQHQHQHYPQQTIYPAYIQTYGTSFYPQALPLQYQNSQAQISYSQYQSLVRSSPIQPYVSSVLHQPHVPYTRSSHSPAAPASLQTHLEPALPSSSTRSSRSSSTIPVPLKTDNSKIILDKSEPSSSPEYFISFFKAPLPWLSRPELGWPEKRTRKKRRPLQINSTEAVELPNTALNSSIDTSSVITTPQASTTRPETPSTNHQTSDDNSTIPSTPTSILPQTIPCDATTINTNTYKQNGRSILVVPALPKSFPRQAVNSLHQKAAGRIQAEQAELPSSEISKADTNNSQDLNIEAVKKTESVPQLKALVTPKLWTGLFSSPVASTNGVSRDADRSKSVSDSEITNSNSLTDVLKSFNANSNDPRITFLEPRGLVNAGNMCYMNSILQVLVFCSLFYNFLDQVSKRAICSFKSTTPLLEAMVLFMREYSVIHSTASLDQLRTRLKEVELEQYGEPFTPDFFYNIINRLPRFSSMRHGHQQDAEEFLGFLLEGLHDECTQVIQSTSKDINPVAKPPGLINSSSVNAESTQQPSGNDNGWLEIGPKHKAAVTRSSGVITTETPVTKIFGGNLRSELRVPGLKDSVTMEPYQSLQLDIGASHVNNIIDALKSLTRSEPLHGDFKSPKGPNVIAYKQVFIDTLPPVLILHLKRFQYDNTGGTQKIWKKVGYPLELELPKELFPRQKRMANGGHNLPKYRLIAAVYHHGKNASGGHYTVDVRRQDGREWIRLDDTIIRRIRSEEVAEGGSEEDLKDTSTRLKMQNMDTLIPEQDFAEICSSKKETEQDGWKQACGSGKKWSSVVNGTSACKEKSEKFSIKDNKVAYLLFYQKI